MKIANMFAGYMKIFGHYWKIFGKLATRYSAIFRHYENYIQLLRDDVW